MKLKDYITNECVPKPTGDKPYLSKEAKKKIESFLIEYKCFEEVNYPDERSISKTIQWILG